MAPDSSASLDSATPRIPLTERMAVRLDHAGKAFDRRHGAVRPGKRRGTTISLASMHETDTLSQREMACLRSVFSELGDAHRRYRQQTGQAGTPALRAAAHAFKQAPSADSLLPVAVMLDDLEILAW